MLSDPPANNFLAPLPSHVCHVRHTSTIHVTHVPYPVALFFTGTVQKGRPAVLHLHELGPFGLVNAQLVTHGRELGAILSAVDVLRRGTQNVDAHLVQLWRQIVGPGTFFANDL